MTSQINPNNINGAYPVAGQDNNSQGFRDNFTNTATNFGYAAAEITDLQNKVVLKAALTGTTLSNNMLGSPLSNAVLSDMALATVQLGVLSGNIPIDYTDGQVYTVTTNSPISLVFTNWPDAGNYGWVIVQITVANTAHTVTFPTAVSVNTNGVQGLNTSTNVMTFATTGVYTFAFSTVDAGATITLTETNKRLQPYNASSETFSGVPGPASLAVTTTLFPTGGSQQATLANGVNGQIKVFIQIGSTAASVTVASAGWTGGSGTVGLSGAGESAVLQWFSNKWWCIGGNGFVLS